MTLELGADLLIAAGGTAGPVLANQEVRRGGTAHSGPTISDTLSISNGLSVNYTRPSISTTSAQTSNQTASHNHNYDDELLESSTSGTSGEDGTGLAVSTQTRSTTNQQSNHAHLITAAELENALSIAGGDADLTGTISLNGGVSLNWA